MRPVLLTDIDGVILDWSKAFCKWATDYLGPLPESTSTDVNDCADWLGIPDKNLAFTIVRRFQESDALGQLEAYHDALECLPSLHKAGFAIVGVTSCGNDPATVARRWANLHQHFGRIFCDVICLPVHSSKSVVLKEWPKAIWVDDAHYHAQAGHEAGHQTFYMHRNLQAPPPEGASYESCVDWHCLHDRLIEHAKA